MGNSNCKPCSCNEENELIYEIAIKNERALPYEPTTPFDESTRELHTKKKSILKLEALWLGYTFRKQVPLYRKQREPQHGYFSYLEMHETLNKDLHRPITYHRSYTYKSGATYNGDWLGGFRHGFGIQQYPNGELYEGQWSYGFPFGNGKFTYFDQEEYEGIFKQYFHSSESHINTVKDGYSNR